MWREGIDQLKRAVEIDPTRAAAWYYLGEALNHTDDLAGALAAYERAVELQPANPKALYGIGKVLDRLNRPDEATVMYRRSREMTGR
jgi:cytochrome c-type biogenesis protein CcmH/NrfG